MRDDDDCMADVLLCHIEIVQCGIVIMRMSLESSLGCIQLSEDPSRCTVMTDSGTLQNRENDGFRCSHPK